MRQRTEDILAMSMVPGLGTVRCGRFIRRTEEPDRQILRSAREMKRSDLFKREKDFIEGNGISVIALGDEDYPASLENIYAPPVILFCKGNTSSLRSDAVAIVGSRRCTAYGMRMAEKLAFELASRGIVVVSGLARGIDTSAHRGALRAGGSTIGVMGGGFRNIFPPEASGMIREMSVKGCVVTEYTSDISPDRHTFPNRNRIISGLSRGVIVVEAAGRSGALITAEFALEQGREVFALPGNADSSMSAGTNRLIQDGAKLVTRAEDVLEELGPGPFVLKPAAEAREGGRDDTGIMDVLAEKGTVHRDDILDLAGVKDSELSGYLLELELKGMVESLPGGRYRAIPERSLKGENL